MCIYMSYCSVSLENPNIPLRSLTHLEVSLSSCAPKTGVWESSPTPTPYHPFPFPIHDKCHQMDVPSAFWLLLSIHTVTTSAQACISLLDSMRASHLQVLSHPPSSQPPSSAPKNTNPVIGLLINFLQWLIITYRVESK